MSKIVSTREQRLRDKLDNIFGNSVAAQELKSIALKSALEGWTDEEKEEYWKTKQAELDELKEAMPEVNSLAIPIPCEVIYGELKHNSSNSILVNGRIDISGEREVGGNKNPSIKHEVIKWDSSQREQEISDVLQS